MEPKQSIAPPWTYASELDLKDQKSIKRVMIYLWSEIGKDDTTLSQIDPDVANHLTDLETSIADRMLKEAQRSELLMDVLREFASLWHECRVSQLRAAAKKLNKNADAVVRCPDRYPQWYKKRLERKELGKDVNKNPIAIDTGNTVDNVGDIEGLAEEEAVDDGYKESKLLKRRGVRGVASIRAPVYQEQSDTEEPEGLEELRVDLQNYEVLRSCAPPTPIIANLTGQTYNEAEVMILVANINPKPMRMMADFQHVKSQTENPQLNYEDDWSTARKKRSLSPEIEHLVFRHKPVVRFAEVKLPNLSVSSQVKRKREVSPESKQAGELSEAKDSYDSEVSTIKEDETLGELAGKKPDTRLGSPEFNAFSETVIMGEGRMTRSGKGYSQYGAANFNTSLGAATARKIQPEQAEVKASCMPTLGRGMKRGRTCRIRRGHGAFGEPERKMMDDDDDE
ncbi:hypothetical protein BGZ60DRAFT_433331 [Tricladium varicosporioides]|nr:hypothetical protein BGZ60DRAFT_433331 [Hymenoscyphus varicosporioides]